MKKTSKEYAEKLAKDYANNIYTDWGSLGMMCERDYRNGYLKACEENNVEGLIEALESFIDPITGEIWLEYLPFLRARDIKKIKQALKKAKEIKE